MDRVEVEKIIDQVVEENDFSGVISIKKSGFIIYEKVFGYADRVNKRQNNINTKFGIASGTKFFTALGIGILIEEGKLSFDSKALEIIGYDFPLYSKDITIRQLLTHTSGMPDYFDEENVEDFDDFTVDIPWCELREPKDYFPVFPKEEMKFMPGEKFAYNNGGYVLLAAIISEISQMRYDKFIEERIFKTNNMNNSGFYPLNKLPKNTAYGYVEEKDGFRTNIYNLPIIGAGDGGAFTTINDLYSFWDGLLQHKILSKEMTDTYLKGYIKESGKNSNLYYGHGVWVLKNSQNKITEYIVGCDAGVSFKSAIKRDEGIVYSIISNSTEGAWSVSKAISKMNFK